MNLILQTDDYNTFTIGNNTDILQTDIVRGLPGDIMEYEDSKWIINTRANYPILAGILKVTSKYKYGFTSRGSTIYLFTPYNRSFPNFLVGSSVKDIQTNKLAIIQFDSWTTTKFPRGNLVKILGQTGDIKVETEALYWAYSPYQLSKQVATINDMTDDAVFISGRYDITDLLTINIDPEGCKDIDDVISYKYDNDDDDIIIIYITISDVSEYVDENSKLDIHVANVGQTLYSSSLPPRNMFPSNLSENLFSLIPGKKRLGVSLKIIWNIVDKIIISSQFLKTVVCNKISHTYDSIYKDTTFPIQIMKDITNYLYLERSITSNMIDINDSHNWVESLMVYYNTEVAKTLADKKLGVFRGQPPLEKIDKLQKYYQNTNSIPTISNETAIFTDYDNCIPHISLGIEKYCYVTSPIRRYVDIINQRILKENFQYPLISDSISVEKLNYLQKQAKRFAKDEFFLQQIYNNSIDEKIEGIVIEWKEKIKEKSSKEKSLWKVSIYVPQWKRFISIIYEAFNMDTSQSLSKLFLKRDETTILLTEGQTVILTYFYNPNEIRWKERMVFNIIN